MNGPKSTISTDVIPAAGKQNDGEKPRASSQTFLSKQGSRIALYTDPLWKKISGNDGQPSSEETQPKCSKAVFASYTPAISNGEFLFRSYFQIYSDMDKRLLGVFLIFELRPDSESL